MTASPPTLLIIMIIPPCAHPPYTDQPPHADDGMRQGTYSTVSSNFAGSFTDENLAVCSLKARIDFSTSLVREEAESHNDTYTS